MNNLPLGFDFDDILIVPHISSEINSRYNNIELPIRLPLITAPMDTVVDLNNMRYFLANGVDVALPRTIPLNDIVNVFKSNPFHYPDKVFFSMGFAELDKYEYNSFRDFPYAGRLLIDVANGHMKKVLEYADHVKTHRPDIKIMVGNIANPDTYRWYAEKQCVDYIRVGIGNGGGCLTTKQSGVGYPMASLIDAIHKEKLLFVYDNPKLNAPAIVADGGMKSYADVVKALALGADYVMIGSIFNRAIESCAQNYCYGIKIKPKLAEYLFDKGFPIKKHFRGMSTKGAQKAMGKTIFKTSEGVVRFRNVEYKLNGWLENFEHYLRNAMSYSNARTLNDFIGKAEFCQITKSAYDRFNK